MTTFLLTLSAITGVAALYPYIRDILRGRTRPRIVTWAIWTFLAGVMTVSALFAHEIPSAVLSAQGFIGCGLVTLLGYRQGKITIGWFDLISLIGAIIGLLALIWLRNPTVALILSVGIDAIAFGPTLVHAWTDPDEESLACYALDIAAASLAAIAGLAANASVAGLVYPLYSLTFNALMVAILVASKKYLLATPYAYAEEDRG